MDRSFGRAVARRALQWLACLLFVSPTACAFAAQQQAATPTAAQDTPQSLLQIVHSGGLVGYLTMSLSVAAVAVVIEHLLTIRLDRLMPPRLVEQVSASLKQAQWAKAAQQCRQSPCLLASVLQSGLAETDAEWPVVEKAIEDSLAEQAARLYRRVEYLSVIGNIAPMLGLLGTVIGMVMAFREVATTQGAARAADLAEGIYLALVTTVQGLIVAIPSLAAFAVLRNRLDALVADVASRVHHLMSPLRHRKSLAFAPVPPPVEGAG